MNKMKMNKIWIVAMSLGILSISFLVAHSLFHASLGDIFLFLAWAPGSISFGLCVFAKVDEIPLRRVQK